MKTRAPHRFTASPPNGDCKVCGLSPGACLLAQGKANGKPPPGNANGKPPPPVRRLKVTPASTIKPRPVRWLWPDRIPAGALTLLAGREGIGKSLIGIHLAARLSRGDLPGQQHGKPARSLFATSEDAWEFTMIPRLIAAGADLNMIGRVQVDYDGMITGLSTPIDVPQLADYIDSHHVAMLALDPLTSAMDGKIDAHRDREVRTALEPLGKVASDTDAAVLGLVHLGKGLGTDPVNLILGSRAFSAVARVALVAARDPDDENGYVLSVEKSNLGRIDVPGLTYRINEEFVSTGEGLASTGLLAWTGETERRVRDFMGEEGDTRTDRDEAAKWLTDYLTDSNGEAAANEVKAAARKAGFSERTLDRARGRAGVTTGRSGFGKGAVYVWRLGS